MEANLCSAAGKKKSFIRADRDAQKQNKRRRKKKKAEREKGSNQRLVRRRPTCATACVGTDLGEHRRARHLGAVQRRHGALHLEHRRVPVRRRRRPWTRPPRRFPYPLGGLGQRLHQGGAEREGVGGFGRGRADCQGHRRGLLLNSGTRSKSKGGKSLGNAAPSCDTHQRKLSFQPFGRHQGAWCKHTWNQEEEQIEADLYKR